MHWVVPNSMDRCCKFGSDIEIATEHLDIFNLITFNKCQEEKSMILDETAHNSGFK
jgi:hypothetical protein